MKIVLFIPSVIPPKDYGGTERVVYWLAKALSELGHKVILCAKKGSWVNNQVEIIELPEKVDNEKEYLKYLPKEFDIVNFHYKINYEPDFPYLHTMHGHPSKGEFFPLNTSFVSKAHAEFYGGKYFIRHGIDLSEYTYCENKREYFAFLSKISIKYKNLSLAIKIAKNKNIALHIGGGWRFSLDRRIKYFGMVDKDKKNSLLSNAKALIFPTKAFESFGLVVVEALACGTPVIASDKGAMAEIIDKKVGFICKNIEDYYFAVDNINRIKPEDCRKYVEENFSHLIMGNNYVELYKKIVAGKSLEYKYDNERVMEKW